MWSAPIPTEFTNDKTKFHCGRLPDGRYYCVSCPLPGSKRDPLVLSTSRYGIHFVRNYIVKTSIDYSKKVEGMHKGEKFGYPHTVIKDGWMYIICSLHKEGIAVLRAESRRSKRAILA
jgi:hypothetical protein